MTQEFFGQLPSWRHYIAGMQSLHGDCRHGKIHFDPPGRLAKSQGLTRALSKVVTLIAAMGTRPRF
jgi:hypothetical protein